MPKNTSDQASQRNRELPLLDTDKIERLIFEKTNDERLKGGRKRVREKDVRRKLEPMADLRRLAAIQTENMVKYGFFDHTDNKNRTPRERLNEYLPGMICGLWENIGRYGGKTEEAVATNLMRAWMKSPGHRRNILEVEARFLGVAVRRGKDGLYYATQEFLNPVARLEGHIPPLQAGKESQPIAFRFMGDFPRENLTIFLRFPDENAVYHVDRERFFRGVAPVAPSWISGDLFQVRLPLSGGRGRYVITMNHDGKTYNEGLVLVAR